MRRFAGRALSRQSVPPATACALSARIDQLGWFQAMLDAAARPGLELKPYKALVQEGAEPRRARRAARFGR